MKLDKTRPYNLIYGSTTMRYDQDGRIYGWDEKPIAGEQPVVVAPVNRSEIMKAAWARRKSA
jgi:hypothetical protein